MRGDVLVYESVYVRACIEGICDPFDKGQVYERKQQIVQKRRKSLSGEQIDQGVCVFRLGPRKTNVRYGLA